MSEIISSPLIFSEQEVSDRFKLHKFIDKLFIPVKAGSGDLTGLPADELLHIFRIQHPMNCLTTAIVSNMLLTGGFIDQEDPEISTLYAKINEPYFLALKKEAQLCLLPFIKPPLDIRYRQIILDIKIVNVTTGETGTRPKYIAQNFVHIWTLNKDNASNYMHAMNASYRSSALEVYNYYRVICALYHLPAVDKTLFSEILEEMGYQTTKGRVHNKAGIRYYIGLYIPTTIEERVLSVELNMCCIFNGNTHWTRMGVLENCIEAQRAEICAENLERMGLDEQERKEIEEEKARIDIRRTFETGEIPLGSAKKKTEDQNNMGYNGGNESESSSDVNETSIPRTSGFNGTEDNSSANASPIKPVIDMSEPLDIGETYRDRYEQFCEALGSGETEEIGEASDAGYGDDIGADNGPGIEEIASALIVPYKMTGENFTKEVMADWLQKMSIPDPEIVLEHYDEVMEILLNS